MSGRAGLLAACYRNALALAVQHGLNSIAFSRHLNRCVRLSARGGCGRGLGRAIADFLADDTSLSEVRLVFFAEQDAAVFVRHQAF